MTKCCQRTSGDFAAEGCHRRRFPVDYRNHEKTYVPATSGNEDSIHNLEADSQADPPANRTRSGHGDQDTLADVHPVEPSSGADLPAAHADGVPERRVRRGGGLRVRVGANARGAGSAPQHVLERQPQARPEDGRARVLADVRLPQGAVPGVRVVQVRGLSLALQGARHTRARLFHYTADAQLLRLGAAQEAEGRREAPHEPRPRQPASFLRHRGGGVAPRLREGGGDDGEPEMRGHPRRGQGVHRLQVPVFACNARRVLRREVEEEHQAGGRLGASGREARGREELRGEGASPEGRDREACHAGDGEVVLLRRRRPPLRHSGGGVRRQDARDVLPHEQHGVERSDDRGAVQGAVGDRDVLQGAQADLPDPRLHRLQRERGQVAGLDGAPGAHAPALPPPRLEMEAQLLAARGRGAGVRVAAAQRCGTARILRREWDSTWWNPRGAGLQTPVFAGFPAVRRRTNGTARVEKPAFSGLSGIAMKNGGVYRSSAYSRTQVAARIFEHYELTPMWSGMVVS